MNEKHSSADSDEAAPEDTPETVAAELAYFDAHAERFAEAHRGLPAATHLLTRTEPQSSADSDEVASLRSRLAMAEGCAALVGINVDVHAIDIATLKSTMAKLIAAEKEIKRLRAEPQTAPPAPAVSIVPELMSALETVRTMIKGEMIEAAIVDVTTMQTLGSLLNDVTDKAKQTVLAATGPTTCFASYGPTAGDNRSYADRADGATSFDADRRFEADRAAEEMTSSAAQQNVEDAETAHQDGSTSAG